MTGPGGRPLLRCVGVALAAVIVTAGCGRGPRPGAAGGGGITTLVGDAWSTYTQITVHATATGRTVVLPSALAADVAPLVAARTFATPEPLASYGLDRPIAVVTFRRPGAVQQLEVGATDFDAHGFYVQRSGDRAVYLVLSGNIRPVLAAAGIEVPAPT